MNDLESKMKKLWIQAIKQRLKQLFKLTQNCLLCQDLKVDCSKCPIDADNDEPLLTFSCEQYCFMIEKIESRLLEQLEKVEGSK